MPSAEAFGAEDAVGSEVKARSEWTGCVCHGAEAFTPGQEESDLAGVVWRGVAWRGRLPPPLSSLARQTASICQVP